jgi:hypothetical protein
MTRLLLQRISGGALALVLVLLSSDPAWAAPPTASTRLTRARAALNAINAAAFDVQRTLSHARRRRKLPAVACVDVKLSQAHAHARLARAHFAQLERALARGNKQRARANEHALKLLRKRAQSLAWAAQRCTRPPSASRTEVRVVVRAPRRR